LVTSLARLCRNQPGRAGPLCPGQISAGTQFADGAYGSRRSAGFESQTIPNFGPQFGRHMGSTFEQSHEQHYNEDVPLPSGTVILHHAASRPRGARWWGIARRIKDVTRPATPPSVCTKDATLKS
jgi:hypothetical protein